MMTWRNAALLGLALYAPVAGAQTAGGGSQIGSGGHAFGLGVALGYPTAISGKYYLNGQNAIDAALAFANYGRGDTGVYLHATYLWHPSILASEPDFDLGWHVGIGGVVTSAYWGYYDWRDSPWTGEGAGVRVPIGLDFDLRSVRVQFFGDIALHAWVVPQTWMDIAVSIGGRYYF